MPKYLAETIHFQFQSIKIKIIMALLALPNLIPGTVVKRPSAHIKSPYVADVQLDDGTMVLAHTPMLGCGGLADKGARVFMEPKHTTDTKCSHVVMLSQCPDTGVLVGIHPKLAENAVASAFQNQHILPKAKSVKRETTITIPELDVHSRFDFSGVDADGNPFVLEVKSVPLAMKHSGDTKSAYFPEGYRKKKNEPVSPRALKHIRELETLHLRDNRRCIMCFVVQRSDVSMFMTAPTDPIYKQAVKQAVDNGVELMAMCIHWEIDGTASLVSIDLPHIL